MKTNTTNYVKPKIIIQIIMATTEVNSWPQEAKVFVLEPPSTQEKRRQNRYLITRRWEENKVSIQTGPETIKILLASTILLP